MSVRWNVGDCIRVKGQSVRCTIVRVVQSMDEDDPGSVEVVWFDKGEQVKRDRFPIGAIVSTRETP